VKDKPDAQPLDPAQVKGRIVFENVTFSEYSSFINATFEEGLDLDRTTVKNVLNFSGAKELGTRKSLGKTSRETYRILKSNFTKLGNRIESNAYFSLEMKKRKKSLRFGSSDWWIYTFHDYSSGFGMCWLRPVLWIILISLLTYFYMDAHTQMKDIFEYWREFFTRGEISKELMSRFQNGAPFANDLKGIVEHANIFGGYKNNKNIDRYPIIFFLSKIAISYLYYQFIMAVRKDTKR
jgi:hypothetical protein